MRIAQVAPLIESVPPRSYGGTERIVSYLTEELVSMGHRVTLFATADSVTKAELVPCAPRALRTDENILDPVAHTLVMLEQVFRRASDFEMIHFHTDYLHFPLAQRSGVANLTTLHGRLDLPDLVPLFRQFADMPLISVSNAQRLPVPWLNWMNTIYHGLPERHYHVRPGGNALAFVGRISPEKRLDRAIEIAQRAGCEIRIGAKIDPTNRDYYEHMVKPLFDLPGVEYLGELRDEEKAELLGSSRAMLFPIDWPEPFGLVAIEAMAVGTPVIAFDHGAMCEVVNHGVTGYIVYDVDEAVEAVEAAANLDRLEVRATFERRFTAGRMARDYLRTYYDLVEREAKSLAAS